MPPEQTCSRGSSGLVTSAPSGYLSSVVSTTTGCGRRDTPWKLTVRPGQRINISLYDFSAVMAATSPGENEVAGAGAGAGGGTRALTQCRVYAVIRERTVHRMRNITVCGTKSRERNVYISLTNTVEIGLIVANARDKEKALPFFLVKYEGW